MSAIIIFIQKAIAQGIGADHGGKIWADSREGTVTLNVSLPLIK